MSPPVVKMIAVALCDHLGNYLKNVKIPRNEVQVMMFIEAYTALTAKNINLHKVPADFRAYWTEQYEVCYAHFRRCLTWLEQVQDYMYRRYELLDAHSFPNGLPDLVLPL